MMTTLLTLASVAGTAVGFGLAKPEQCQDTLGAFCDPTTPYGSICVYSTPAAIGLGQTFTQLFPREMPVSCDPSKPISDFKEGPYDSNKYPDYTFCSSLTSRATMPVMQMDGTPTKCQSQCLNPGAYCDTLLKTCAVPVATPTKQKPFAKVCLRCDVAGFEPPRFHSISIRYCRGFTILPWSHHAIAIAVASL
jgi:hypothetical protein